MREWFAGSILARRGADLLELRTSRPLQDGAARTVVSARKATAFTEAALEAAPECHPQQRLRGGRLARWG